jgi:hypothetical protein
MVKWLHSSLLFLLLFSNVTQSHEGVTPFNWLGFGFTEDGRDGYLD